MTVALQSLDEEWDLFMCSGQSLVIGLAAVEFEVWLCDFASCPPAELSALPAHRKTHTAICLQFEYLGCGRVTEPYILFLFLQVVVLPHLQPVIC